MRFLKNLTINLIILATLVCVYTLCMEDYQKKSDPPLTVYVCKTAKSDTFKEYVNIRGTEVIFVKSDNYDESFKNKLHIIAKSGYNINSLD